MILYTLYMKHLFQLHTKENNSKITLNCHRLLAVLRSTRASGIHSTRLGLAPPQMSLYHHRHPTGKKEKKSDKSTNPLTHHSLQTFLITHFISTSVNRRPVMNMRRGMVRMSTKGRAREIGLDFTIHKTARHTIWMAVNKCIRPVLTCKHVQTLMDVIMQTLQFSYLNKIWNIDILSCIFLLEVKCARCQQLGT